MNLSALRTTLREFRGTAELTVPTPRLDEYRVVATETGFVFSVLKNEKGWSVVKLKSQEAVS